MELRLTTWCNRFIKIGFYLLFGLVPLLLTPWNYELFEYNKMMAVYAITTVVATAWLIKMVKEQQIRIARTPLDIPILLFVASQLVSALFSIDPHVSWFGYYSRFNGGMWSVMSYVLLYYAFVSNNEVFISNREKSKDKQPFMLHPVSSILKISLVTGTIVAVYGVLERLGIDKHLWVQDVQNRVFATLGQPNWLAAYLVALIPISMAMGIQQLTNNNLLLTRKITTQTWIKPALYGLMSVLFFVTLLFTRSRSGLFGFVVADLLFWALLIIQLRLTTLPAIKKHPLAIPAGILHLLMAGIIFINGTGTPAVDRFVTFNGLRDLTDKLTTQQSNKVTQEATPSAVVGPALEVGGTESGTIRKYVWQGAINAWNSTLKTKLIGTGTETFAFAFYQFRPVAHNNTSEWDFLYNKAHNEYLNYVATTGVFGLGSYLLFIGTFIWWFIRHELRAMSDAKNKKVAHHPSPVTYALFAGWVSLLVTNFFGFSVVILQVFLFLFPAIIIVLRAKEATVKEYILAIKPPMWVGWIVLLLGIYTVARIGSFWYADTLYASGYRLSRSGLFGQAIPALTRAIALNRSEPVYHDELASGYATLSVAAFEGNNATQAAQLAALAVEESIKALTISPKNVNFYKTRTKVYFTLSSLDPSFNAKAIEALEMALTLSPNDPKIYYNLAILVGRDGDTDGAITHLLKAKELKPNYRDVYYALWVFYTEEKKPTETKAILEEYLKTVDPNDTDFQERLE